MASRILLWEELANRTLAMKCKRESSRLWNKLPVFSGYVRFPAELLLLSKAGKILVKTIKTIRAAKSVVAILAPKATCKLAQQLPTMLRPLARGEKFDRFQTLRYNTQQHPTTCNRVCKRTQHVTSNNVGSCWWTMLRPFARSLIMFRRNATPIIFIAFNIIITKRNILKR